MAIQAQLYQDNLGFPLFGSQDLMMMPVPDVVNGCGANNSFGFNQFCFNVPQKNQQQVLMPELQNLQPRNDNVWFDNTKNNTSNTITPTPSTMAFSHSVMDQVEKQRQEIDQYVKFQNERLRLLIQEQRKQQFLSLIKKVEPKLLGLLRYKDEELFQATKRSMELEDLLRKLETENQIWQRVAQENEAMVMSLNNSLEEARERALCCFNNGAEDAESCCDVGMEEEENREVAGQEQNDDVIVVTEENREHKTTMVCKACNSRSSSVLFLPCRHLCSCKICEPFLDSCPVCRTTKKASIEALIF
ncbi:probable BOI-related E3 ubiquitin-protein ligase 3 [Humulus lupulus]|uniref:probable BOI-related E3 ubiquitin-protein ligase 3 n=1 Tax=Humulus lupulus TaxID=3486 RepID=UPI002B40B7EC|nr:probable BOI-related E3 ubiquitin-protein ligase 3 [Humulus lupulus]